MGQICLCEIPLEGVLNAREWGGIPLRDGRVVKHGKLIRTGRLSEMTKHDKEVLFQRWNVTGIIDLRNDLEVEEHPDPELAGVDYYQIPIFPGIASGISKEDGGAMSMEEKVLALAGRYSGGRASKLLQSMYPRMVTEEYCLNGIREFFRRLVEHGDGALLWHCTSGKDRTGLTGALLLYILGADWETIVGEYLHTNWQIREYRDTICDILRRKDVDPETIEQITILESVDAAYLENCRNTIVERYGTVESFLEETLGLTSAVQQCLRDRYTSIVEFA